MSNQSDSVSKEKEKEYMEESKDLYDLLNNLKLLRYFEVLYEGGYETNEDLIVMEMDDLKDFDIKQPHKKRIINEIQKLKKILQNKEGEDNKSTLKSENLEPLNILPQQTTSPPIQEIPTIKITSKEILGNISTPKNLDLQYILKNANPETIKIITGNEGKNMEIKSPVNLLNRTNDLNKNIPLITITPMKSDLVQNIPPSTYNPKNVDITNLGKNILEKMNLSKNPIVQPITQPQPKQTTPLPQPKKLDKYDLKRVNGLLLNCCQMGNLEMAKSYVEQGANALEKALSCASSGGHKKLALYLIEMGAKDYNNALLGACKSGNLEMMLEMYNRGANNLEEGLKEAKMKKHKNLIFQIEKILKEKESGPSLSSPQKVDVEEILTLKQMNALLLNYSQIGNFEMVKRYVEQGANILDKALSCACSGGQKQIVQFLIDKGAKDFDNAFLTACKSGNREMALEMIKKGAKNLEQGLEIAKKRENEDMQYDIRNALFQMNLN